LNYTLYTLYYISVFIPIVTIIFFFLITKNCTKVTRTTVLLLPVLSLLSDLTSGFLLTKETSMYVTLHIYTLFTGLVCLMYFRNLYKRQKNYFLALIFIFCGICATEFLYKDGYQSVNVVANTALSVTVFIVAFFYFFKAINELKYPRMTDDIHFYINFAFLFYYGTTFFFALFEPYIRSISIEFADYSYYVLFVSNITFNIIISTGIWLTRRISY